MPEREDKDKAVILTALPRRKVIIRNVHGLYITRERELHDNRWIIDNQYGKTKKQ